MGGKKKLKLCLCSLCRNLLHRTPTGEKPGQMLELRLWKTHAADEELRAAEEDYLLHHTLVASVVDPAKDDSLAARPRDHEDAPPLLQIMVRLTLI